MRKFFIILLIAVTFIAQMAINWLESLDEADAYQPT